MRIPAEADLAVGGRRVGQGKRTFERTVAPHLDRAGITTVSVEPTDFGFQTNSAWTGIDQFYRAAGQSPLVRRIYDAVRKNSADGGLVARLTNAEVVDYLQATGLPLLTYHGLWGIGADRHLPDGDVPPEPLGADPKTTTYVPLTKSADLLRGMGKKTGIEVVGFMVPEELKDDVRIQERRETLLQPEPTKEQPLRLAFMKTGQFAHMDILYEQVLKNETLVRWIKNGQAELSVYLWTGEKHAREAARHAREAKLPVSVTTTYQQYDPDQRNGVQIFWNSNPDEAVQGSFAIAADADVIITPLGERIGWTGTVPVVALPPVGRNPKMQGNLDWARIHGLAGPDEDLADLAATLTGDRIRTHYDRAEQIFPGGVGLNGAELIADHMRDVVRSSR